MTALLADGGDGLPDMLSLQAIALMNATFLGYRAVNKQTDHSMESNWYRPMTFAAPEKSQVL